MWPTSPSLTPQRVAKMPARIRSPPQACSRAITNGWLKRWLISASSPKHFKDAVGHEVSPPSRVAKSVRVNVFAQPVSVCPSFKGSEQFCRSSALL
jgi:hypothetical protein